MTAPNGPSGRRPTRWLPTRWRLYLAAGLLGFGVDCVADGGLALLVGGILCLFFVPPLICDQALEEVRRDRA
jgi:hypothetical protein